MDDNKIQKSIHMLLEKMVKKTKDKLEWWSKAAIMTAAKLGVEDP